MPGPGRCGTRHRAAHGGSRCLLGAAGAAEFHEAHGRPLHLLRPFRAGRVPRRAGHRRAAAPAYRSRDGDLSLSPARSCTATASAASIAIQPGRGQLDDRRARHRPFRARAVPIAAGRDGRCTGSSSGLRCRDGRGGERPGFWHHAAAALPVVEGEGKTRARRGRQPVRRALAGRRLRPTRSIADVRARGRRDPAARCRARGARGLSR